MIHQDYLRTLIPRFVSAAVLLALLLPPAARSNPEIEKQVQALLESRCRKCHHPDTEDEYPYLHGETTLADLVGEEAVVVGDPGNSPVYERITRAPGARGRMPKSKGAQGSPGYEEALAPAEIALIERWITGKEDAPAPASPAVTAPAGGTPLPENIAALLGRRCEKCHSPETSDEKPYLHPGVTVEELILAEAGVVPGKPELSAVVRRVSLPGPDRKRMPRSRGNRGDEEYEEPLTGDEIGQLTEWVAGLSATPAPAPVPLTEPGPEPGGEALPRPRPATFAAAAIPEEALPPGLPLDEQAKHIFRTRCQECHHPNDVKAPDFGLPLGQLTSTRDGGRSIADEILERVRLHPSDDGFMPEGGSENLPPEEIAILERWFSSGKEELTRREWISRNDELKFIYQDIRKDENSARFYRYLTLTNLYNVREVPEAGGEEYAYYDDEDMEVFRAGLSVLINSLSMGGKVVQPVAIDPAETIYRIDLRNYGWSFEDWDRVSVHYPHGLFGAHSRNERYICEKTGAGVPFLRADWFTFAAAQPPLYDEILDRLLEIESGDDSNIQQRLETRLEVDRVGNLQRGRAVRAGFLKSGVSDHNRLIERHEAAYGGYWVSYDFKHRGASDAQDLRKAPLGPLEANLSGDPDLAFDHDGGEMIFNLPNGLQGYLLATAEGARLRRAPLDIVRSNRGDGTIINGISCIQCHKNGMKPAVEYSTRLADMEDTVRPFVEESRLLGGRELALFQQLHPGKSELQRVINLDAERFADARKLAIEGFEIGNVEPVSRLYESYHLDRVTSRRLAAEFGIEHEEMMYHLEAGMLESDSFRTTYFSLKNGDAEPREQMLQQFLRIAVLLNYRPVPFEPLGYEEFEGEAFAALIRNDPLFRELFGTLSPGTSTFDSLREDFDRVKEIVESSEASSLGHATGFVLLPDGGRLTAKVEAEVPIGGEGTLQLFCDRDLHLRILLFSADGRITQFYPNEANPESFVPFSRSNGQPYNIPFTAIANRGGKIGAEYFRIYASHNRHRFAAPGRNVNGFTEFAREEIFNTRGAIALKAGFGEGVPKAEDSKFIQKEKNRLFETKVGYVLRPPKP